MRGALAALLVVATFVAAMVATADRPARPRGSPATCRHQSSAGFPKSKRDLVVGPLVLVGAGEYTTPETIARFGGQKYPAVVLAGHRVTVQLPRSVQGLTSLLYADDHWSRPDGERTVEDGHRTVTFRACGRRRASSRYDGRRATFWSGFVLSTTPRCLPVRIWVDDERTARQARIPLGERCKTSPD
jgi:hypothetical protein